MSNDIHYSPECDAEKHVGCAGFVLVWSEWRSEDRKWVCDCACHGEVTPEVREAAARDGFFFSGAGTDLWVSNAAEARSYPYRRHSGALAWLVRYFRENTP